MRAALQALLLALTLGGFSCGCDRGGGLTGQAGELVVVVAGPARESLTREALLTLDPVVMDERGDGQVRLRNIGVAALTIVSVSREGGSDALTLDDAAGRVIPRDGEVTLSAHFAPPTDADVTKATVEHRADFRVQVSGGRPGEEQAAVTLVAVAVARDCYVPAVLDFGQVPLGQHVTLPLLLENGRPFPASTEVSAVEGDDPLAFALPSAGPFEVNPGQRVAVPVSFGPLEERAYHATLRVRRAATCAEGTTVLTGVGSSQAISWTPSLVDFGRVPLGVPVKRTVTVVNGSGAPLGLQGVLAEGAAFSLVDPVPVEVPARGSAVLTVACAPSALGRVEGVLSFDVSTVETLSARVPMTCVGGAPRIRLAPAPSLAFGSVPLNVATSRRLSVQNVGAPPAAPGDTSNNLRLGVDGRLPWVAIVPTSAATKVTDFEVVTPAGYDPAVGLPAISGLNALDFDVRLTATTEGRKEADLFVYSNDPLQPLAGVRVSANPREPGTCELSLAPGNLPMGDIPRGASFERTMTITAGPSTFGCLVAVDLAPGSASTFSLPDSPLPVVMEAGDTGLVKLRATADPALPYGATARGFLRVQAGRDPPVLIPTEMRVANCLVLDPNALDFGTTRLGCRSGSKPLHAYNACGVPLFIDRITFRPTGGPFALTSTPTIPSGGLAVNSGVGPASVQVAFAPITTGPASGALDFDIREGGVARVVSVDLAGQGALSSTHTDTWTQTAGGKLDVLFVVDDSCSMGDEQMSLASNFASFIAAANQSNVDYHLGVTTTDIFKNSGRLVGTPAVLTSSTPSLGQAFAANALVGTSGSGLEEPFEAASRALSQPNLSGANAGFLRQDASLAIILVTDAVEQSPNPVATYRSAYRQAKGGKSELVSVNVVGPFSLPSPTCFLDSYADTGRYAEMVSTTNGVQADICTTNWAADLATIGQNIVQPRLEYQLTSQPDVPSAITVRVDGVVVGGWTYRGSSNAIVFSSGAAPPAGSTVTATYETPCF
ncbi:MAG: choice-of-anchor D domain-containing protein [Myxococcales bacterium]|nr:choice-of-anchor D domain-containing protein [Myxococcales bacterium]